MSDRSPTLANLIRDAMDARLSGLHVCLPARVEKIDTDKQLVNVQPLIQRKLTSEDGTVTYERMAVITNVPLALTRGASWFVGLPVKVGDNVLVHFVDYSMDTWIEKGGEAVAKFGGAHRRADCFAVPGGYAKPQALTSADYNGTDFVIGKSGGAVIKIKDNQDVEIGRDPTDYVALAQKVATELGAIITKFNTHTHPVSGAATTTPVVPMSAASSVAASKTKAL